MVVAFIGLGQMGFGMALNLRKKLPQTTPLRVYDLNTELLNNFEKETKEIPGEVIIAKSKTNVLENADVVFTCLPQAQHVYSVIVSDEDSVINKLKGENKLVIDCSTINSETSIKVGQAIAESKPSWAFSDAPVSGGPHGSRAGTLTCMVGCSSPDIFPRVKELVSCFSVADNIFNCGKVGAGETTKAINNYAAAISIISMSEAFNIGLKAGIDKHVLASVINASSGASWVSQKNHPVPGILPGNVAANNDYEGGFKIELCRSVMGLATDIADNVGAKLVLKDAALGIYDETMKDPRFQGKDARVIFKWLTENNDK